MKKHYVMGVLICISVLLGYLQYGREEKVVNTMVSTSDTFCKQEFSIIANKLFVLDNRDNIIDGIRFLQLCYGQECVWVKLQVLDGVILIWKKR